MGFKLPKKKVRERGSHFRARGCPVDLEVVFNIKRKSIRDKNHANKITKCYSGDGVVRRST